MARIVIFGAGAAGKKAIERLSDCDVMVCFADNDQKKHHTEFCSYLVRPPEDLLQLEYDYILIGSMYHQEIKRQLLKMGVSEGQILVDPDLLVSGNEAVSWGCFIIFVGSTALFLLLLIGGLFWWWKAW